jgi:hypothetical protein
MDEAAGLHGRYGFSIEAAVELEDSSDLVLFARERLGFAPDAQQEELLRTGSKRVLLNCTRQWGKSTVAAVRAVHRAWYSPGSMVLVVSPGLRQSGDRRQLDFPANDN